MARLPAACALGARFLFEDKSNNIYQGQPGVHYNQTAFFPQYTYEYPHTVTNEEPIDVIWIKINASQERT